MRNKEENSAKKENTNNSSPNRGFNIYRLVLPIGPILTIIVTLFTIISYIVNPDFRNNINKLYLDLRGKKI